MADTTIALDTSLDVIALSIENWQKLRLGLQTLQ